MEGHVTFAQNLMQRQVRIKDYRNIIWQEKRIKKRDLKTENVS